MSMLGHENPSDSTNALAQQSPSGQQLLRFEDLSERQRRGLQMFQRAQASNGMMLLVAEDTTLWFSATDPTRAYQVTREQRNRRGILQSEYRCQCADFKKHGVMACKHAFAERLRRGEVKVTGTPRPRKAKSASRRPARKRLTYDGKSIRSAQRSGRQKMWPRLSSLIQSLAKAYKREPVDAALLTREQKYRGGRTGAPLLARAMALLWKVSFGLSADDMVSEFASKIDDGILPLLRPPNPTTLGQWMNDERLTPILESFLRLTTIPFREREIGAIIDSTKISQMQTAHSRHVEYGKDQREGADWAKCHALVGVESLIVMALAFSGSTGDGSHDIKFVKPLVEKAQEIFDLKFLLGDKAYLSQDILSWLWERSIKAVIPIKKGWFRDPNGKFSEPVLDLVKWFDCDNNRLFHEDYRLRSKIEALFSVVKRLAGGYCWSRGRKRKEGNAQSICTAWRNELLCKFIFINLRTTVQNEEETGFAIDYLVPSRRFPKPDEPLLKRTA